MGYPTIEELRAEQKKLEEQAQASLKAFTAKYIDSPPPQDEWDAWSEQYYEMRLAAKRAQLKAEALERGR